MPAPRDRFVQTKSARKLMKGSGDVALLKPDWAKAHGIRNGMATIDKKKVRVYSVLDIAAYKKRIMDAQEASALESDAVRAWRAVVDQAAIDGNDAAETWANDHLITAITTSNADVVGLGAITLE